MAEKKTISQNDLGISLNQMESLARILLPILREYLASEEGLGRMAKDSQRKRRL